MKAGKRIFAWHHWCGLVVGVFLLLMSTSGALLVFSDEIEAAYEMNFIEIDNAAQVINYDASVNYIRKAYPGWEIRLYGKPQTNQALVFDLRQKEKIRKIFAHPATGAILHVEHDVQWQLHRWLLTLHYTLFAGTLGKAFVFIIGLLFLISLLTGVYIYRKAVLKVLRFNVRINNKTSRGLYSSLHRVVGVWSLLFNLLIVITGLFISGRITLTALESKAAAPVLTSHVVHLPVDAVLHNMAVNQPDFTINLIRIAAGSNTIQLSGAFESDPFYYGKYYSRFVFGAPGALLQQKELLQQQPLFKKWQSITGPLHFGNYGGLPVKIIYSILGLMPGLLSISGFLIWIKRKNQRKSSVLMGIGMKLGVQFRKNAS